MNRTPNETHIAEGLTPDALFDTLPRISNKKREAMLDAAVLIFSRDGYDGGKTLEIAREAGVSEATLFKYFGSKHGLLSALSERIVDRIFRPYLLTALEQSGDDTSPEQAIASIMQNRMRIIKENLPLLQILLVEAPRNPAAFSGLLEQALPRIFTLTDSFHETHMHKGVYRNLDPRLVSRTFLSLMLGCVALGSIMPEQFQFGTEESEAAMLADVFLNGVGDHI